MKLVYSRVSSDEHAIDDAICCDSNAKVYVFEADDPLRVVSYIEIR